MTYSYQQDNKGEMDEFDESNWAPLEKFFIFLIFLTKTSPRQMKGVMQKTLPLFDFLQHTTMNKLLVIRNLFEELDENCKFNNLTLNQNLVKTFYNHVEHYKAVIQQRLDNEVEMVSHLQTSILNLTLSRKRNGLKMTSITRMIFLRRSTVNTRLITMSYSRF